MEKIHFSTKKKYFNMVETSISVAMQNIEGNELGRKASIYQSFLCRKRCLMTVAACIGTSGQFVPSLSIFSGKKCELGVP
jgi:hypothetical protein